MLIKLYINTKDLTNQPIGYYNRIYMTQAIRIKIFIPLLLICIILSASLFFGSGVQASSWAKITNSSKTITTTNVCLIYSRKGVFSGGVPIRWPGIIRYRYLGKSDAALLWLPGRKMMIVRHLVVRPLNSGCFGILNNSIGSDNPGLFY